MIPNHTLAHIHALRCYLQASREAYKWDIFAAHLGKKAAITMSTVAPVRRAYQDGQDALITAAKRSLRRTREMERLLDQILKEIKEAKHG
jgi:hypothetical protein